MPSMNAATRPPELECFTDEMVANGRYRDLDEVIRTGLGLLRQAEAERDGFFTIDKVMHDADALIEELARDRR